MKYYFDHTTNKYVEENNEDNGESLEEYNNLVNAARKAGLDKKKTIEFLESFGYKNGEYTEKEPEETL